MEKEFLTRLYGDEPKVLSYQNRRYKKLKEIFFRHFGKNPEAVFSVAGRIEISGNHTDHNNGLVLAASVNPDMIAAVGKSGKRKITLISENYEQPFIVDLEDLTAKESERGMTTSLIKGVVRRFRELRFDIGGFDAFVMSDILAGAGLSSSASIEILLGMIFNYFFNDGKIDVKTIAKIGQFAENFYFGKPCGLMDQLAIAGGGIMKIDFRDKDNPAIEKIDFDFTKHGYSFVLVNTRSNHRNLTEEYESIPAEMKSAASVLGAENCREITYDSLLENISEIRRKFGDRCVLRVIHFLQENERVLLQTEALKAGNITEFLRLMRASGNSSVKWLQNIFSPINQQRQELNIALAVTERFLKNRGAYRVHGGGFGGTILVLLPINEIAEYEKLTEKIFGKNCLLKISLRQFGTLSQTLE